MRSTGQLIGRGACRRNWSKIVNLHGIAGHDLAVECVCKADCKVGFSAGGGSDDCRKFYF